MDDLISRQAAMAYPLSWEHYDKEHGDRKFICGVESYREYIESLPSAQQWIPCSERLPDLEEEVLVDYHGRVRLASLTKNDEEYPWYFIVSRFNAKLETVKAWMPLPSPYREEAK